MIFIQKKLCYDVKKSLIVTPLNANLLKAK